MREKREERERGVESRMMRRKQKRGQREREREKTKEKERKMREGKWQYQ